MKPEDLIKLQLEAGNRPDLLAFAATHAQDVRIIETDGTRRSGPRWIPTVPEETRPRSSTCSAS